METRNRYQLIYLLVAMLGVFFIHDLWTQWHGATPLPYSEFQQLLADPDRQLWDAPTTDASQSAKQKDEPAPGT